MDFEKEYNSELNRRLNMNATSIDELRNELHKHEKKEQQHFMITLIAIIFITLMGGINSIPYVIRMLLLLLHP